MMGITHNARYTKLYAIWTQMKTRCYNKNYEYYYRYGGRGITICESWKSRFVNFKEWAINHGYVDGLEIERINNDKGYSPCNCCWATRKEQMRNRVNTVYIENNGVVKPLIDWSEQFGIKYKLAHERYKKGWTFEEIFKPLAVTYAEKEAKQ